MPANRRLYCFYSCISGQRNLLWQTNKRLTSTLRHRIHWQTLEQYFSMYHCWQDAPFLYDTHIWKIQTIRMIIPGIRRDNSLVPLHFRPKKKTCNYYSVVAREPSWSSASAKSFLFEINDALFRFRVFLKVLWLSMADISNAVSAIWSPLSRIKQ